MSAHRFSTAEYYQLGQLGLLHEHTELLDGIITDMGPITPLAADIAGILAQTFIEQVQERFRVRVQQPVDLGSHSLPQPDLVLCRPGRYRDRHPGPADVSLLIEISDTTNVDLRQKLDLYKSAGIAEYWVVDLQAKVVHRFVAPDYVHQNLSESISPVSWPDIKIDLRELF